MCGIVGYIGNKKASPILINGLLRLEYRGYDSAGIATMEDDRIVVNKNKGRVNTLYELDGINDLKGTMGIAHLRYARYRLQHIHGRNAPPIPERGAGGVRFCRVQFAGIRPCGARKELGGGYYEGSLPERQHGRGQEASPSSAVFPLERVASGCAEAA